MFNQVLHRDSKKIPKESKRFKKDSKRIQKIPKCSKRFQKIPKDSKRIQKILRKASIAAKHSTVLARWPKKLMSPGNPLEFKELDAPTLLGRLKKEK